MLRSSHDGPCMSCDFGNWPLDTLALGVAVETAKRYPSIREDHETLARLAGGEIGLFLGGKGRYAEDHARAERGDLDLAGAAAIIGAVCARRLAKERARALGLGIWDFARTR